MAMDTETRVINDYLERLERAAQVLPPDRRIDLLAEIREHIDTARTADEIEGEAATLTLLERLGAPEQIVAAAAEGIDPWPGGALVAPKRSLALEIWTVLLLTVGSIVLPVIGWLIGVVLLWLSSRWQTREKLLGTLVIPGGLGVFVLLGAFGMGVSSCFETTAPSTSTSQQVTSGDCDSGSFWTDHLMAPTLVLAAIAALVVPLYLLVRARAAAAAETA